MTTHTQFRQLLEAHPRAPLWVNTAFTSPFGLAWLHTHTASRPVKLLIGDLRTGFQHAKDEDINSAIDFCLRRNVDIFNWYSKRHGGQEAHHKLWLMLSPDEAQPIAALVGSANLTRKGLYDNLEAMAEVNSSELSQLYLQQKQLFDKAWHKRDDLIARLRRLVPEAPRNVDDDESTVLIPTDPTTHNLEPSNQVSHEQLQMEIARLQDENIRLRNLLIESLLENNPKPTQASNKLLTFRRRGS